MQCKCKRDMQPLVSGSNIKSSEWYCHLCHKSVLMGEDEVRAVMQNAANVQAAAMQGQKR